MTAEPDSVEPQSFMRTLGGWVLYPGEVVCRWLRVEDEESKALLRMFVNLTVYGKLALLAAWPFIH
ncbi:MAG: hypothetical protein AAGL49_06415 [Pseudomonadota bacterium]